MATTTPQPGSGISEPGVSSVLATRRVRVILVQSLGITTFLVGLIIAFGLLSSDFLTYNNFTTILTDASFYGLVALGQTLVIVAGGFDLSVAGVAPLAAVIFAQLSNGGSPIAVSMAAALAAGAVVGLGNGIIVTKGGINPLITTLGTMSITTGLAFIISRGESITILNVNAGFLANTPLLGLPNQVWLAAVILVILWIVLRYTTYGRGLYSLGGNKEASWLAGIRVDAVATSAYILCGLLAALGGIVLASELLAGDGTLGNDSALISVAAVVLGGGSLAGGAGGAPGTIVGVLVLETLEDGLTLLHVSTFYQQVVTGIVLLVAVGFSRVRARVGGSGT